MRHSFWIIQDQLRSFSFIVYFESVTGTCIIYVLPVRSWRSNVLCVFTSAYSYMTKAGRGVVVPET